MLKNLTDRLLRFLGFKGLKIVPEFNEPTNKLEWKYDITFHADVRFKIKERIYINKAIDEWNKFCNGMMTFKVIYDYDLFDVKVGGQIDVIHRVSSLDHIIYSYEKEHDIEVLGLYAHGGYYPHRSNLYLVHNRLWGERAWKSTAMHEIGHYVGMQHVLDKCIMQAINSYAIQFLNRFDAEQFAELYYLNTDDLHYLKGFAYRKEKNNE